MRLIPDDSPFGLDNLPYGVFSVGGAQPRVGVRVGDSDLAVEWNGEVVSRPPYASMYWSPAQMLAHLTATAPGTAGGRIALGEVTGVIQPARTA